MTKYNVHIYAVVRVLVRDVEAESYEAAITKAIESEDLYARLSGVDQEFSEELTEYHVDVVGDEYYSQSKHFIDALHGDGIALAVKNGHATLITP